MSVITSERHLATGAKRTCPKCQGGRLTVQFESVRHPDIPSPYSPLGHKSQRDRFQCLDCWHVWYEEVK